ncbi:MAG: aldo/keto reductase [Candidatus Acidiferrum sp.]
MNYRRFGRTEWSVSDIGYGTWGMGGWTGSQDADSLASLQRALDLGCNFFDTAWIYGEGHSETLIGKVLRGSSGAKAGKKIYVATKIPPKNRKWPSRRDFPLDDCYPAQHVEEYVDKSLKNLGVETIDLIQFHTWEDSWMDDERMPLNIEKLRKSGKVGAVGISINRWQPWNALRAVRAGIVDAVQVVYNIFDQNPEDELFPACIERNVAIIARVPFDEGSLTGTLTPDTKWPDGDWRNSYFDAKNLAATLERVEAVKTLVPEGMSLPDLALRFILSNPAVSTVIPGMRKSRHVETNLAASDRGPLPAELIAKLRAHRWDRVADSRP